MVIRVMWQTIRRYDRNANRPRFPNKRKSLLKFDTVKLCRFMKRKPIRFECIYVYIVIVYSNTTFSLSLCFTDLGFSTIFLSLSKLICN